MDKKTANHLAKSFLEVLEDLQEQHNHNFIKLKLVMQDIQKEIQEKHGQFIPLSAFVTQADFFDDEKFQHLRKRILDKTNDLLREYESPDGPNGPNGSNNS